MESLDQPKNLHQKILNNKVTIKSSMKKGELKEFVRLNKKYFWGIFFTILVWLFILLAIYGGQSEMKDCINETHDLKKCSFSDRNNGW
jgi:hypothetical protein